MLRKLIAFALAGCAALMGPTARAATCDEVVAEHMTAQALLTAHLVAVAEKASMKPAEINAVLKDVAERSAIEEFWVTDTTGHAYLTNTGIAFTFSPDPAKQPQASAFWPCSTVGRK